MRSLVISVVLVSQFLGCGHLNDSGVAGHADRPRPTERCGKRQVVAIPPVLVTDHAGIQHTFRLRNDCSETIVLEEPVASCGCTKAALDTHVLEPGACASLSLDADLYGRSGRQRFTVIVSISSPPQLDPWLCELRTTALPQVELSPPLVVLGDASENRERTSGLIGTAELHLRSRNPADMPTLVSIQAPRGVDVSESEGQLVEADGVFTNTYMLKISLNPTTELDNSTDETKGVVVNTRLPNGTERSNHLSVLCKATMPFRATPRRVFQSFSDRETGGSASTSITIRRIDGKPFRIHNIESSLTSVVPESPTTSRSIREEHVIVINAAPPHDNLAVGELRVEVGDSGARVLRIPVVLVRKP